MTFIKINTKRNFKQNHRICTRCGKPYFQFNIEPTHQIARLAYFRKLCWECMYWDKFFESPPDHLEIIGNRCYQVFDYVEHPSINQILGGNGETKYILKTNGSVTKTNDFWWLNIIPIRFQQQLQPTAWWITENFYNKMVRSRHHCFAKSCMDRYHCFRYDISQEYDDGPRNVVPRTWHAGDEKCPAFLPLLDIENYNHYVL